VDTYKEDPVMVEKNPLVIVRVELLEVDVTSSLPRVIEEMIREDPINVEKNPALILRLDTFNVDASVVSTVKYPTAAASTLSVLPVKVEKNPSLIMRLDTFSVEAN